MARRRTREQWLEYLNNIHDSKYDYSRVDFKLGVMCKQIVICPNHGEWGVTIDNHSTKKSSCPKCKGMGWDFGDFVKEAINIHGYRYNYSKTKFINQGIKVEIICKKHGSFFQSPSHHLYQKQGCYKCGREDASQKHTKSISELENKARKIHFEDYKYMWDTYVGYLKVMDIECIKHGVFKQTIANHCQGQGCPVCKKSKGELKVRKWLIEHQIEYIPQKIIDGCISPTTGYNLFFDFYLPLQNICIEFDGEQHFRSTKRFGGEAAFNKIKENDETKNRFCEEKGIKLIRIPYNQIKEVDNILCNLI